MEAEPSAASLTPPPPTVPYDARHTMHEAEARALALKRFPKPPEGASEATVFAWKASVDGYSASLQASWSDPDHARRIAETGERLRRQRAAEALTIDEGPFSSAIQAITVGQLLELEIPERQFLLEPWLREKEIAMIHAWRGVGKTYVGLSIAYAIASGGRFLTWHAPRPRKVLYIDGEMPVRAMQERLAAIIAASEVEAPADNLHFVCADLHEFSLPNLSTAAGQEALEPCIAEADVIVIDSLSTLASHGRENDSESWLPMQEWALSLRRRGKTLVLFHHDGKGGQQRGTSRKEDILDVTIHLRRPSDYEPQQGARFEVHFDKTRSLSGPGVEPFEAALETVSGKAAWRTRKLEDARVARAAALFSDGCTVKDVMHELNVSRPTAYRLKKQATEQGLLGDESSQRLSP